MKKLFRIISLVAALVIMIAGFSRGQTLWTSRDSGTSLNLDLRKPLFVTEGDDAPSLFALYAGFQGRVGPTVQLVGEIPITYASYTGYTYYGYGYGEDSKHEISLGNPHLGIRFRGRAPRGAGLPTSGDLNAARSLGNLSNVDRLGTFAPEVMTLRFAANIGSVPQS